MNVRPGYLVLVCKLRHFPQRFKKIIDIYDIFPKMLQASGASVKFQLQKKGGLKPPSVGEDSGSGASDEESAAEQTNGPKQDWG